MQAKRTVQVVEIDEEFFEQGGADAALAGVTIARGQDHIGMRFGAMVR